jgi:hypothetical protein
MEDMRKHDDERDQDQENHCRIGHPVPDTLDDVEE